MKTTKFLLSFFGTGYLPKMPGTWGSLGAFFLYLVFGYVVGPGPILLTLCLTSAVVFAILTIVLGGIAEKLYGRKDPGQVVTDEVAGFFLAAALLIPVNPLAAGICAFFLFRFFDILKPPPANLLERLEGGWGLTLDDIAAGIYSSIISHLVFLLVFPGMIVR